MPYKNLVLKYEGGEFNVVECEEVFSLHVPLLLKKSVQPFHLHLFGHLNINSAKTFQ